MKKVRMNANNGKIFLVRRPLKNKTGVKSKNKSGGKK